MAVGNQNAGYNKRMNGRQDGKADGRVRNTQTSNASRNGGVPTLPSFGASFGSVGAAAGGLATAWAALQNQMAMSAQQRKGYKAAFKTERANIRSDAVGQMSEAINAGIEGGMTGSSAVAQQRIGVLAERREGIEAAKTTMNESILASKAADMQAQQQFAITQAQIELQAEAARQQAALQRQAIAAQQAAAAQSAAQFDAWAASQPQTNANGVPVFQRSTKFGDFIGTRAQFKDFMSTHRARQSFIKGRIESGRM